MDRETILKHSKSIRLNNSILPDIMVILEDICKKRNHPEYLEGLIQAINIPMIGQNLLHTILEEYEKEYHIIRLTKNNQIIDIW